SMMLCDFLLSNTSKSSFVRSVMKRPFLSETVKSMLTRETSRVMRFLSCESAGGVLSALPLLGCELSASDIDRRATAGYSIFMGSVSIIGNPGAGGGIQEEFSAVAAGKRARSRIGRRCSVNYLRV